jgi:hypothetical protein
MRRRGRLTAAVWMLVAAFCFPSSASAEPEEVTLGLYLTNLSGFNLGAGTFDADFWLWTRTRSDKLAPLESLEIINAATVRQGELTGSDRVNGVRWDQQRVRLTARSDFHTHYFPFDRQKLSIIFEDSLLTSAELVFAVDRDNSRVSRALNIPGWTVLGWNMEVGEHLYITNFGDPSRPGPTPASRIVFSVEIKRQGWLEFIELTLGAFVAFAILALSFRMNPTLPPIFAGRMGVIVASVFTVTISLRNANSAVALPIGSTLVDRIHLLTLAAGFAAAVGAAAVRYVAEGGREADALTFDRWAMPIFVALYIVAALLLVIEATQG